MCIIKCGKKQVWIQHFCSQKLESWIEKWIRKRRSIYAAKRNFTMVKSNHNFALLLAVVWFAGIVFLVFLAVRQPGVSIFMITAVWSIHDIVKERKMAIIINIDVMLAKRKMSVTELSEKVGITMANISILKNGKAKAIKVDTLNKICRALDCQPGDILEYVKTDEET